MQNAGTENYHSLRNWIYFYTVTKVLCNFVVYLHKGCGGEYYPEHVVVKKSISQSV
jgi:hypothetical protein